MLLLELFFFAAAAWASEPDCTIETIQTPFIVRDQSGTATCWMHSALQMMEQSAQTPLSIDALLLHEIRSRALVRFLGHKTPWDGGAGPTRPFALALAHGLIPEQVWRAEKSIVKNYHPIFEEIEGLLIRFEGIANEETQRDFLSKLDQLLLKYTGTKPPENFLWDGRRYTAQELARKVIGEGPSMGYDFRNIQYDDSLFGHMDPVPWTTIISKDEKLVKITNIIKKRVVRMSPDDAFKKAIEIFKTGRPVALTFIYSGRMGRTFAMKDNVYISITAEETVSYTSSHLVLISGLVRKDDEVIGLQVLDPLVGPGDNGLKIIPREFFLVHGKTVHEVLPTCDTFLK